MVESESLVNWAGQVLYLQSPRGAWRKGPRGALHHQLGCWKQPRRCHLPSGEGRTDNTLTDDTTWQQILRYSSLNHG